MQPQVLLTSKPIAAKHKCIIAPHSHLWIEMQLCKKIKTHLAKHVLKRPLSKCNAVDHDSWTSLNYRHNQGSYLWLLIRSFLTCNVVTDTLRVSSENSATWPRTEESDKRKWKKAKERERKWIKWERTRARLASNVRLMQLHLSACNNLRPFCTFSPFHYAFTCAWRITCASFIHQQ